MNFRIFHNFYFITIDFCAIFDQITFYYVCNEITLDQLIGELYKKEKYNFHTFNRKN